MTSVYLSLGSNISPRLTTLNAALDALALLPETTVKSVSSIYETEAVASTPQRSYLNLATTLRTTLSPKALLEQCRQIESSHGRPLVRLKDEPRTLDIDIIFFGNRLSDSDELKLPHPRYSRRCFVLEPLAEIAPNFICPDTGISVKDTLNRCNDIFSVISLEMEAA
ncbi:MAG: 2-amino-4-hydroxy-6-hydroxymethyldihydropteridine diphosphokinase [Candidatus Marinimicrobia bacterium]|nr:2-amino-4-hydroxy-6-hydroxymethyldihydropteridine diphosphokinase [Candidatus Neomarinimicrobiota bacterium]|tara:strand:- start:5420 stop:5920 length:501 start_codon:yes stop_codon:yes gene_type:complete